MLAMWSSRRVVHLDGNMELLNRMHGFGQWWLCSSSVHFLEQVDGSSGRGHAVLLVVQSSWLEGPCSDNVDDCCHSIHDMFWFLWRRFNVSAGPSAGAGCIAVAMYGMLLTFVLLLCVSVVLSCWLGSNVRTSLDSSSLLVGARAGDRHTQGLLEQ